LQALQDLQVLLCNVDIVGPSVSLGYALVATFIWGLVVRGILAVDGCSVAHCRGSPKVWGWSLITLMDLGNHWT
ncbi:hypothetical protein N331_04460, partial [Merops nubicus]